MIRSGLGKAACTAIMTCGLITLSAHQARAWSLDFTMVNKTDQPIVALWASPTSSGVWGPAVSDVFVRDYGGEQKIEFDYGSAYSGCYYDLRFKFAKGVVRTISNISLCSISTITIDVNANQQITYATNLDD